MPGSRDMKSAAPGHWLLRSHLEHTRAGQLFYAPYDIVFTQFDVVEPDLMYFSRGRAAEVLTAQHARGAPELVIEIASKGTRKRDETVKRRLYERSGVSEYWVVDPEIETIRVYRLANRSYGRPFELSREAGDVLTSPLFPGLELPLDGVFGE